jgi:hypothetical protein
VNDFLSQHPGGELAILTFAGKDATEEFDMIHPPDVIEKYAPDAVIGVLGEGGGDDDGEDAAPAASGGKAAPLLSKGAKSWERKEKNRKTRMENYGKCPGCCGAFMYMVLGFMKEIIFTIFPQTNIVLTNDRIGLTRSALFLFLFIIIHGLGNLHVFLGPDDFNGYGYFYVRLYWFGLPANVVEIYVLFAAVLHVAVALKRTWDISINYTIASGKLNLAISGVTLLTFMCIHLYQFRMGETQMYMINPPKLFINVKTIWKINLFWEDGPKWKPVRDIYRLEFDVFQSFGWCFFYVASVAVFSTHMCLGWQKCVPAPVLDIPKRYHTKAVHFGYIMTAFIAAIYISFPFYAHCWPMRE